MISRLFVYGTLQHPEQVRKVTGRTFQARHATLLGYARFMLKGAWYPAIVPRADAEVSGLLLSDVDENVLRTLDEYEGDEYLRQEVNVHLPEVASAWAYVLRPELEHRLSSRPWDLERFQRLGEID